MNSPRPFYPGIEFSDGRLLMFDSHGVTVCRPWPTITAWRKTRTKPWRPVRPRLRLEDFVSISVPPPPEPRFEPALELCQSGPRQRLLPFPEAHDRAMERTAHAARAFLDAIPEPVRDQIRPFTERNWHLLSAALRAPGMTSALKTNPGLAFAAASVWAFRDPRPAKPMRTIRRLMRLPQPEAVGYLGFPGTRMMARILARIRPDALTIPALLYLRKMSHDAPWLHLLRQAPQLGAGALRLGSDPELMELVTPALFREVCLDKKELAKPHAAYLLKEVQEQAVIMGRRLPRVQSLDHLDDLLIRYRYAIGHSLSHVRLPPPILPGDRLGQIVPLTTARAIIAEGQAMAHCVAQLIPKIALRHRDLYIYRLMPPLARGTLAIARSMTGNWIVEELRGSANSPIPQSTQSYVRRWLLEQQGTASVSSPSQLAFST